MSYCSSGRFRDREEKAGFDSGMLPWTPNSMTMGMMQTSMMTERMTNTEGLLFANSTRSSSGGHIQTAAETYGLGFEVPISPPGLGAGISASWNITAPREGLHLIQGRLMGNPESRVSWIMNENEVSKGGIYEQPMFAVVVRHTHDRPFRMMLTIKATTCAGLPVTGKGGARIMFNPASAYQSSMKKARKSQRVCWEALSRLAISSGQAHRAVACRRLIWTRWTWNLKRRLEACCYPRRDLGLDNQSFVRLSSCRD